MVTLPYVVHMYYIACHQTISNKAKKIKIERLRKQYSPVFGKKSFRVKKNWKKISFQPIVVWIAKKKKKLLSSITVCVCGQIQN